MFFVILEGLETDSAKSSLGFLDDLIEGHLLFFFEILKIGSGYAFTERTCAAPEISGFPKKKQKQQIPGFPKKVLNEKKFSSRPPATLSLGSGTPNESYPSAALIGIRVIKLSASKVS